MARGRHEIAIPVEQHLTFVLVLIGALGIFAQWLAWRLHVPAIVLLLLVGLIAGPLAGWVRPTSDLGPLLHPVIKVGVAIILFEGGLSLHLHELKQAAIGVWRLVSLGVVCSWTLGTAAAHYLGALSWPVALVFGAITVVTGPTVILPLLRQSRLRRRPASYLKWEGIINDPIGVLLAVLTVQYFLVAAPLSVGDMVWRLGLGVAVAGALGSAVGYGLGEVYRRGFVPEYLKGPGALVVALVVYHLANLVQDEAGLVATTVLGIVLGNMRLPGIGEMRRFKEYIAIVLVSSVFIILTAELDPSILLRLDWHSAALLLALLFVVRPVSVLVATARTDVSWQERALLAWIAPRGIVAAAMAGVFAPALEARGFGGADRLLPLVFTLILTTVVLHGFTIGWLARRLGLSAVGPNGVLIVGASSWTVGLAQVLKDLKIPVLIADTSWHRLRRARLAAIPVYYGEVLSESSEETLELNEMGYLLAATDNDAYNSLVCGHFANQLGRNRVFQVPVALEETESRRLPRGVRGLMAPSEDARYEDLLVDWYRGWTFQKATLTDEFTYQDFLAARPERSLPVPVLMLGEGRKVRFNSQEQPISPKPGDTLVWFGVKGEKVKPARAAPDGETLAASEATRPEV